ncbi:MULTISPECIES: FecR family protein [Butyricimonas]|uniref:FecR family protein n=1 Tax=Butyricimonas TaxID=574697 RepID=UPI0007FB2CCA|nr:MULTISPECIES: FecR family protein [Butyricimonas]
MDKKNYRIIDLVWRFLLDDLSAEEREELRVWREGSEEREAFFQRVCRGESLPDRRKVFRELNALEAYKKFRNKTRRSWINTVWRYAAILTIPLLAGVMWMWFHEDKQAEPRVVVSADTPPRAKVEDKVILVLSDGKKVGMTHIARDSVRLGTAMVMGQEGRLVYDSAGVGADTAEFTWLEMNKVITATGGFYSLVLSDGSRVWLNSESELEFPVLFGQGERVVRLAGEAFFEVSKDASRPFIVETDGMRTRVLGTSFNIKSYADEPCVRTTLFTGKVQVVSLADTTREVVLLPGQQADWDTQGRQFSVTKANLEHARAWKDGLFVFHKENIEVVMRQIERWYGVKFVYQLEHRERYTLNGYFNKDESLQSILDIFTFTVGLEFKIDGNVVYIKNKMEQP